MKFTYKLKNLRKRLESKMTPFVEFILTLLFGWTGIRWWIRGKYSLGFRMLLTFGLLGIGWVADTITCMIALIKSLDIEEKPFKFYTVVDENYPEMGKDNCFYSISGFAWLDDIDNVSMHNTQNKCNYLMENINVCTDFTQTYRRCLYFLDNKVVCTNVEGVDFEYDYEDLKSLDIYNDAIVISDGKYIQTIRANSLDAFILYNLLNKKFKECNYGRGNKA